jgi:hypothetical protein
MCPVKQRVSRPPQFTIAGVLLATTLVALSLTLWRYVPCLGAVALVLLVPALSFSLAVGRTYRTDERPLTFADRLRLFGLSLIVSILAICVGMTVFATLAAVLWPIAAGAGLDQAVATPVALILAAIGGFACCALVLWRLVRLIRSE